MKDQKSNFVRIYKRKSKSPWDDHSTILLLADYAIEDSEELEISYSRYIYQHRDSVGRTLGISISKSILETYPEFDSQYLEGLEMLVVLLLFKEDIQDFCVLFEGEFEDIYGISPNAYFETAELHWAEKIDESL